MTSDLSEAYQMMNKGMYFTYHPMYVSNYNKLLQVLGFLSKDMCYLCNNKSAHISNGYKLCALCYDNIQKYHEDTKTMLYNDVKIKKYHEDTKTMLCDDVKIKKYTNFWITEMPVEIQSKKYKTSFPNVVMQIVYLGKHIKINGKIMECYNCYENVTYDGEAFVFDSNYLCMECYRAGAGYFDLNVNFYIQLKQIFIDDIACHTILCYHKFKLQNAQD